MRILGSVIVVTFKAIPVAGCGWLGRYLHGACRWREGGHSAVSLAILPPLGWTRGQSPAALFCPPFRRVQQRGPRHQGDATPEGLHMKRWTSLLLATVFAAGFAVAADAKTLVFCSEGSPEGFDPGPYTTGTTMDASSQAIYNRLVEFVKGTTQVGPGLAESWDVSPDGLEYTFHLRKGVKFQTTAYFTPTRDFNADDVIFTFERQWKKENPYFTYSDGIWECV